MNLAVSKSKISMLYCKELSHFYQVLINNTNVHVVGGKEILFPPYRMQYLEMIYAQEKALQNNETVAKC